MTREKKNKNEDMNITKYISIYNNYIGYRLYVVFILGIVVALTRGFGFTLLLPLLRSSQSSTDTGSEVGAAEEFLNSILSRLGIADSMAGILLFIVIVFLIKGLLQFARRGYVGYVYSYLVSNLKNAIYESYSEMEFMFYSKNNTGHFINVINQQVDRFYRSFKAFVKVIGRTVTSISFFSYALFISWKFALSAIVAGLIILYVFKKLNKYVRSLSRKISEEMSHLNKLLVQALQSFEYIVATHQKTHLRSGVQSSIKRLRNHIYWQQISKALTSSVKEPVSVLLIAGIIATQVFVFGDPVTPLFVAILLIHKGTQVAMMLQADWQEMMNYIGAVEMVNKDMYKAKENRETSGSEKIKSFRNEVSFANVSFSYDGESLDLKDVSLTIKKNTTVAFVGESGAGKSTLVRMLTLLLKPDKGSVQIDGVVSTDISLSSWRSLIGYVSQKTVVFDATVADNICMWRGDMREDAELSSKIINAAKRAHAHSFIKELPSGYQTVVGERGMRLSGGQRQRLFIARELFKKPDLLILDEATSALDTKSERSVQGSIDSLRGQVTVVIVAHRLSTIKNVDRVYVLENGKIIEKGSYEELRFDEGSKFKSMIDMQKI